MKGHLTWLWKFHRPSAVYLLVSEPDCYNQVNIFFSAGTSWSGTQPTFTNTTYSEVSHISKRDVQNFGVAPLKRGPKLWGWFMTTYKCANIFGIQRAIDKQEKKQFVSCKRSPTYRPHSPKRLRSHRNFEPTVTVNAIVYTRRLSARPLSRTICAILAGSERKKISSNFC